MSSSGKRTATRTFGVAALSLSFALLGSFVVAVPAAADAAPTLIESRTSKMTKATAVEPIESAPDYVSARIAAQSQGSRVEVLSEKSETSRTFVNPDGTWTLMRTEVPVRLQDAQSKDGWRDLSFDLETSPDGALQPEFPLVDVAFNGGGATHVSEPLVQLDDGKNGSISLDWEGALPTPTIEGDTATYANVAPNTDLVLKAARFGFEQSFVIKEAPAVGEQIQLPLALDASGLDIVDKAKSPESGMTIENAEGKKVGAVSPATTWDASTDKEGQPDNLTTSDMTLTKIAGNDALVLEPDTEFLAAPDTEYPVVVDPEIWVYGTWPTVDTWVVSNQPDSNFANTGQLLIGQNSIGAIHRSFLNFDVSMGYEWAWPGSDPISSTLYLWNWYSATCTPQGIGVSYSNYADLNQTTWNTQPAISYATQSVVNDSKADWCGGADWIGIDVTSGAKGWAAQQASRWSFGVWGNESTSASYKSFDSSEAAHAPELQVIFDQRPEEPRPYFKWDGNTYWDQSDNPHQVMTNPTPTLYGVVEDDEGQAAMIEYRLYTSPNAGIDDYAIKCESGIVPAGSDAWCPITTPLRDNTRYWVRAQTRSYYNNERSSWSAAEVSIPEYPDWEEQLNYQRSFETVFSPPPPPQLSCTNFRNGEWRVAEHDRTICQVQLNNSNSTNTPVAAVVSIDGAEFTGPYEIARGQDGTLGFDMPRTNGSHSVEAMSVSIAGVYSDVQTLQYGWGEPAWDETLTGLKTTDLVPVKASAPPIRSGTATAFVQWRVAGEGKINWDANWNRGAGVPLKSDGSKLSVDAQWSTKGLTESGATAPVSPRAPVLLELRVCFEYSSPQSIQCTMGNGGDPEAVLRVPHAFGEGYPTADAGPGQVALWTGEFQMTETDVSVPTSGGELSISRSHSTFTLGANSSSAANPSDNAFGPGWVAAFDGDGEGGARYQVVDNTAVDGTFALVDYDGSAMAWRQPSDGRSQSAVGTYSAVDNVASKLEAKLEVTDSGDGSSALTRRLKLTTQDGVITTWKPMSVENGIAWLPESVLQPGSLGKTTYQTNSAGMVTRITAPVPEVPCQTGPTNTCGTNPGLKPLDCSSLRIGCRALEIQYATIDTANGSTPGDIAKQVKSISYTASDTGGSAMVSTVVAVYSYFANKRLAGVSDPRSGLATSYTYDTSKTPYVPLATVKDSGRAKYQFDYISSGTDLHLADVQRDGATPSLPQSVVSSFVYGVDPSGSSAGSPNLGGNQVSQWNQRRVPTYGAAVFGPDHPVGNSLSPQSLTSVDWQYADLQYTDALGYTINSASYGAGDWQLTSTDYDDFGNVIRTIDNLGIAEIRKRYSDDPSHSQFDVTPYATTNKYNDPQTVGDPAGVNLVVPAGTFITDTWSPVQQAVIDGSLKEARTYTHYEYDKGAPGNGIDLNGTKKRFGLVTSVVARSLEASAGLAFPVDDSSILSKVTTGYSPIDNTASDGETSGWRLGRPTVVTIDMGNSPAGDIVRKTRYNKLGAPVENWEPGSTGSDEATTLTAYYTAGGNPSDTRCGNKPQWAGLVCVTKAASEPMNEDLPDLFVSAYSDWLRPTAVVEESGAGSSKVIRTTTNTYLSDGRPDTTKIDANAQNSSDTPTHKTLYDSVTGASAGTQTYAADGRTVKDTNRSSFDLWGRQTGYTNSLNDVSTTSYVAPGSPGAGQTSSFTDAKGSVSYTYDGRDANNQIERRGLVTKMTVSGVGDYTAAYNSAGSLVTQRAPGGLRADYAYDPATGSLTHQAYTGTNTSGVAVDYGTWSLQRDLSGRVVNENAPTNYRGQGTIPARQYEYDRGGRLVRAEDFSDGMRCVQRDYTFDVRGNRTKLVTTPADASTPETCGTGVPSMKNWAYDMSSRVRSNGVGTYTYDLLGRPLSAPDSDTISTPYGGDMAFWYSDADEPLGITQISDDSTTLVASQFDVDPDSRRTKEGGDISSNEPEIWIESLRHYTDASDSPSWIVKDIDGRTAITRYTASLGMGLEASTTASMVTLSIDNPHGDTVMTAKIVAGTALVNPGYSRTDEYGNALTLKPATGGATYGWLGSSERETQDNGLMLMGARLYNPVTGRFLSRDPVPGGNENAYNYPNDPVNSSDVSGECPMCLVAAPAVLDAAIILVGTAAVVAIVTNKPMVVRMPSFSLPSKAASQPYTAGRQAAYRNATDGTMYAHRKSGPRGQPNVNPHTKLNGKSGAQKHTDRDGFGGQRNIPENPNKRPNNLPKTPKPKPKKK